MKMPPDQDRRRIGRLIRRGRRLARSISGNPGDPEKLTVSEDGIAVQIGRRHGRVVVVGMSYVSAPMVVGVL